MDKPRKSYENWCLNNILNISSTGKAYKSTIAVLCQYKQVQEPTQTNRLDQTIDKPNPDN